VIINNRSYRIIKERLVENRKSDQFVGMDLRHPVLDFVALAQGFGMAARRVIEPAEIEIALRAAIASGAPNLLEVIVADGFGNI
jgi:benzoylformate decarboxylase